MIAPGATIGIVGGGQLGRMLGMAAASLGYRCHIFDPHDRPCAADVAAAHTRAAFDDRAALERFAATVDVATYEFENLPAEPLRLLGDKLKPGPKSLAIAQDRGKEKQFIEDTGARVAPWRTVDSFGAEPAIAEAGIPFVSEFSVILARSADGGHAVWDSPDNHHEVGILRRSTVPAGPTILAQVEEARRFAFGIAEALGHVGVLTVEFFASADGPVVNEIAPRVHNSGHWTIEGAETSQFEQHIRAICGLPLGPTALFAGGAMMENLIGDEVNRWPRLVGEAGLHLHLYGKDEARPGRKMGHTTRVGR
jgi:5-(carboxyamino)imidazole ribonucleotide synthase